MTVPSFAALRRNLKADFADLPAIRIELIADSAPQLLAQAIRGYGFSRKINLEISERSYDQEPELARADVEVGRIPPKHAIVYHAVEKLLATYQQLAPSDRSSLAATRLETVARLADALASRSMTLIYFNYPEIDDGVYGSFANKVSTSFLYQLRKLNVGLMELAQAHPSLLVCDASILAARHGRDLVSDPRIALTTDLLFGVDFLPHLAKKVVDIVEALAGRVRKCLVLDLDNTLWGGVIGDDGLERIQVGSLGVGAAHSELQAWAKQLKERGVVLAVSSKNDESLAKEPFEKHPEMVLRLEDIAVFNANWENKADNIRHIRDVLDIAFDAMVFVDDNPVERELVRRELPDLCVPELPDDPALFLPTLRELNLFETASITEEDGQRTAQYQQEAKRRALSKTFTDEAEFLRTLEMRAVVRPFSSFDVPRVAQLTQRSNQFNLRTIRYTESDVARIAVAIDHVTFAIHLADRFGSYGLICAVIARKAEAALFVDTWLMSCRVLKRGVERLALNALALEASRLGCDRLVGEYISTKKNGLVRDHYRDLGFRETGGGFWELAMRDYVDRPHQITLKRGEP